MKQAIFLIECDTIDGRGASSITFASESESDRDEAFEKIDERNKPWYKKTEKVVDLGAIADSTWQNLNGLQRYALAKTIIKEGTGNETIRLV